MWRLNPHGAFGKHVRMDALEKEHLRQRMAVKMGIFLEGGKSVSCVSGHYYFEPHSCELCQNAHGNETLVIKNRSGKKLHVDVQCLREMVRFRVVEVEDLGKWLEKLVLLKAESEKRREEEALMRQEERKKLEKKVIVRKRSGETTPA